MSTHNQALTLRNDIRDEFQTAMLGITPQWSFVASHIPSDGHSNIYTWLGNLPQMRLFSGTRHTVHAVPNQYPIANQTYESTFSVKRTDIEDGLMSQYRFYGHSVAEEVSRFQNEKVFGLLPLGFTEKCYDDTPFFGHMHPFSAENGSEINFVSNFLDFKKVKPESGEKESPYWYLLCTSRTIKPFLLQERSPAAFDQVTQSDDSHVFLEDEYLFGIRYRCAFAYGFWQMAIASNCPLNSRYFDQAYQMMMSMTTYDERPMGMTPDLLVVPPALRMEAQSVIGSDLVASSSNPNQGAVDVLVSPYL